MKIALSRRTLLRATAVALAIPHVHSANAEIAISTAINRAGRLRALSQRGAKAYGQEVLAVLPDTAREISQTALRLIASGLEEIVKANPPTEVAKLVQHTQQVAAEFRSLMEQQRTREGMVAVARQSDVLLHSAEQTANAYEALSKAGSAKVINVAGRQRMLSQRMTKNYFLIAAGNPAKGYREQIDADRAAFSHALAQLQNAPVSTSSIRNELSLAQSQWVFFEQALGKPHDAEALRNVATTSERLLEGMNNLTELYDTALKELLGRA